MTQSISRAVPARHHQRFSRVKAKAVGEWDRIGAQTYFYFRTLASIPGAVIYYRPELLRLIAQMGLGSGALAAVGGTIVIVGFMTMTTGAVVAAQGFTQFQSGGAQLER